MEKIYSISTILKNLSNSNFLALVSTPWHTYGLRCIIDELQNNNIYLEGYIVILPTVPGSNQYYIDSSSFPLDVSKKFKIVRCSLEKVQDNLCLLLVEQFVYCMKKEGKGSLFFIVNTGIPGYDIALEIEKKYKKVACNIIIDEGLATYMGLANNFNVLDVNTYFEYLKKIFRLFLISIIKRRKSYLYYFILFRGNLRKLVLNEKVIIKYKNILSYNTHVLMEKTSFKNTIIILTQPFVEIGELKENLDYVILKKLINYLHGICEYEILIKVHPKEINRFKYDGLNCKTEINSTLSFEELMAQSIDMPVAVFGFTSTALITASIFWNIPAFSLCSFLKGKEVSIELKRIIKKFSNGFKNYVKIIKNLEEIQI